MERRKFIRIAGTLVCIAAAGGYVMSDKSNITRSDIKSAIAGKINFQPGEEQILYLAFWRQVGTIPNPGL